MGTNAAQTLLAGVLADAKLGTFTSLEITKKGDTRGRGADKKQYGNDRVRVVVLTGFKYGTLLQRSKQKLSEMDVDSLFAAATTKGLKGWQKPPKADPISKEDLALCKQAAAEEVWAGFFESWGIDNPFDDEPKFHEHDTNVELVADVDAGERTKARKAVKAAQKVAVAKLKAAHKAAQGKVLRPLTREDIAEAVQKINDSLDRSIAGNNTSTTDDVFEPLVVDGVKVRGVRVYSGPTNKDQKPAAPVGTIYLQGLKLSQTVVEAAPNGYWETQSGPVTVARRFVEKQLPSGRYVQYKLDPAADWKLNAGGTLPVLAENSGVTFDREAIEASLRKAS